MAKEDTIGQKRRSPREGIIIEAAANMFPGRGIEPVKMTDVAEASGVGVASLYRYFGTKVNLALSVGALLWRRFNEKFVQGLPADFEERTGYDQMGVLFGTFVEMYRTHPELISFLDELDHMVLDADPAKDRLAEYDAEVIKFYPLYKASYEKGVTDGTLRPGVDYWLYYQTMQHALMGVAQKLLRGEIVPSDDFSCGWVELRMAIDVAMKYLESAEQA